LDTYAIVRPEHLNHHGTLFGGQMLKWVDEFAWLVAAVEYPGRHLVTRAMDKIEFKTGVAPGSILRFGIARSREGTTSVTYSVEVFAHSSESAATTDEVPVFSTAVTFACVDRHGNKHPLRGPSK
jgi:acyl-CoA hydrolase